MCSLTGHKSAHLEIGREVVQPDENKGKRRVEPKKNPAITTGPYWHHDTIDLEHPRDEGSTAACDAASSTDVEVVLGQHPRQRESCGVIKATEAPE